MEFLCGFCGNLIFKDFLKQIKTKKIQIYYKFYLFLVLLNGEKNYKVVVASFKLYISN